MRIIFTRYARNRMRWRKITASDVLKAIASPDRKELFESNKYHFYKSAGKRYLRITAVTENHNLTIISVVDKRD